MMINFIVFIRNLVDQILFQKSDFSLKRNTSFMTYTTKGLVTEKLVNFI